MSTIEGYFKSVLNSIKNDKKRNKYGDIEIDIDYILYLWKKQNGKCAVSGIDMILGYEDNYDEEYKGKMYRRPYRASIDRIDCRKGYTKDNVWLVCFAVNNFKGMYEMDTVYYISDMILKNKGNTYKILETK